MLEENAEIARVFTDALNARDIEALISVCDPSIEFHSTFAAVGGAFYQGHDGMRKWFRDLEEAWGEELHSELEAFFDLGEDTLLVFYVLRGRGRQSGAEVTLPAASVSRVRAGLIVHFKAYAHREDALADLVSRRTRSSQSLPKAAASAFRALRQPLDSDPAISTLSTVY